MRMLILMLRRPAGTKPFRMFGLTISSLGTAVACAAAGADSHLDLKYEYFWDKNKVWNHTPAFSLTQALSRIWSLGWEQEFDFVTGASRRLGLTDVGHSADRELDAVSGASKVELRYSENPSVTYSNEGRVATASFYASKENDYVSYTPAVSLSFDFNERNTTLGVSYAEYFDDFKPTGAFAGLGGKKRINSACATLAQTLTPLTLVGLTGTWNHSWGYLGHPYDPPVTSDGQMMTEAVPDQKQGGALAAQIVQGFRMGDRLVSLNLDYRRYQDSWGLKSNTVDAKLSRYFTETTFIRLRLRYYNQTGTSFAKEYYTGEEVYRTADIRSFPFTTWLAGAKISSAFPEEWGRSAFLPDRWDLKFDYTFRDTRGDKMEQALNEPRSIRYQLYGTGEDYTQGVVMAGLEFDL
jgi:hypothetical protein